MEGMSLTIKKVCRMTYPLVPSLQAIPYPHYSAQALSTPIGRAYNPCHTSQILQSPLDRPLLPFSRRSSCCAAACSRGDCRGRRGVEVVLGCCEIVLAPLERRRRALEQVRVHCKKSVQEDLPNEIPASRPSHICPIPPLGPARRWQRLEGCWSCSSCCEDARSSWNIEGMSETRPVQGMSLILRQEYTLLTPLIFSPCREPRALCPSMSLSQDEVRAKPSIDGSCAVLSEPCPSASVRVLAKGSGGVLLEEATRWRRLSGCWRVLAMLGGPSVVVLP